MAKFIIEDVEEKFPSPGESSGGTSDDELIFIYKNIKELELAYEKNYCFWQQALT
ncbi:MAG: hypothetical protein QM227_04290 [Bacillota bacterium]|nr:hypothetical protein [Bacillota bacterium]NLL61074.1 hypothetical protein [Tissierellia bacterium]HRC80749.1 hypothetical protein [Sedimentibacter sp.]